MTNSQVRRSLRARCALSALDEVLVGQQPVQQQQGDGAEQDRGTDHAAGCPGAATEDADRPCRLQTRDDQGERAGCQHDTRTETEKRVLHAIGQAL